jgi:hypothetical protein
VVIEEARMATQILATDRPFLLRQPTNTLPGAQSDAQHDASHDAAWERAKNETGNVFRGLFYALLFNIFLVLALASGWEFWRVIR